MLTISWPGFASFIVLITMTYRFVLPVLPIALLFSGYSLAVMDDSVSSKFKGKGSLKKYNKFPAKMRVAILFLLATNVPMALYMSLVHQVCFFLHHKTEEKKTRYNIGYLFPSPPTPL